MAAQYSNGNSKLETVLYLYKQQRKKMKDEEKEFDRWNYSLLL